MKVPAAEGDFVTVLYNPKSKKRKDLIVYAVKTMLEHRDPGTPTAVVTNAYREDEKIIVSTLGTLAVHYEEINMFSTVIIGNSNSFLRKGWFITPRGYDSKV